MKAIPLFLLATAALSLTGCDAPTAKKETAQAPKTAPSADAGAAPATSAAASAAASATSQAAAPAAKSSAVALPAGLKIGRWQGFLITGQHAVHFVFEVAVENNQAIGYLINEGPDGRERLRCAPVRALGDSAIIGLPGTDATLVVRANGADHLAGTWVKPDGKKTVRVVLSAVYGEQSPLRSDLASPNFAGSWRATFHGNQGKTYPATLVFEQQGAKLLGSFSSSGGSYRYLSGAALPEGMGISAFDGVHGVLLQAKKLPNGTLKGDFYAGKALHETWTAVPAGAVGAPSAKAGR